MKTKSIKIKVAAFSLAALTAFGTIAPGFQPARAAETQIVTEITEETSNQITKNKATQTETAQTTETPATTETSEATETGEATAASETITAPAAIDATETTETRGALMAPQATEPPAPGKNDEVIITGFGDEGADIENIAEYSDPLKEKAFQYAKEAGMIALEKGIDMLFNKIPLVDEFLPSIKDDIKELFGIGSGDKVSTQDLMDRFDSLEENLKNAMDDQTKELIGAMANAFTAGTYKSDLKNLTDTVSIVNAINTDSNTYTEEDRLVQLAMVVGNSQSWAFDGSFIKELHAVGSDLIGKNYLDNRSMFEMLMEVNKHNYQFSGEVIDAVNPYVVMMMVDYLKYTALALSSLTAQQMLLSDTFNAANIKDKQLKKQYNDFKSALASIEGEKAAIEAMVFGRKVFDGTNLLKTKKDKNEYDNVMDSYKVYQHHPRNIHIPSGKALAFYLREIDPSEVIDDSKEKTKNWGENCLESTNKKDFENRVCGGTGVSNNGNNNVFSADEMNKLFKHVQKVVAQKKQTDPSYNAWKFFREVGFFAIGQVTDCHRFIIGDGYEEKNHDCSMDGSRWDTYINTASVLTGEISSTFWKHMDNKVGLFDIDVLCGNSAYYGNCKYLLFRPGTTFNPENCLNDEEQLKGPTTGGGLNPKGPKGPSADPKVGGPKIDVPTR